MISKRKKRLFSPDMKVHTKSGENNLFSIYPAYTIFIEIKYSIQTLHFKQKLICYLFVAMEKMSNSKSKQTKHPIHVILANLRAMHLSHCHIVAILQYTCVFLAFLSAVSAN